MALPVIASATAGLAYLSGRWRLPVDYELISAKRKVTSMIEKRIQQDRCNTFYLVEENATNPKLADKVYLKFQHRQYTFKQFYDSSLHYAGWLHETYKIVPGDIVAINFMNGPEFLFLVVALWSLGAVPALINYNLVGEPLIHSIRTSTARLLILEPEVAANVLTDETKSKLSSPTFRNNELPLSTVILDENLRTSVEYFKPYRAPDSARAGILPRQPAVFISTSGTTGLPKQATVAWQRTTGGGYVSSIYGKIQPAYSSSPDVYYTCMPLYHASAFLMAFCASLGGGFSLAIGRKFSASRFWPDVRQHGATIIQYVGEVLRYLMAVPEGPDDKNHKVRLAFGNGLRPDVWKRFKARFGIEVVIEFYAATEGTFATFNINRNDFSDGAVASYGKITNFLQSQALAIVKVDWEQDEPWRDPATGLCARVATGEAGELLSKLDANDIGASFTGYHNNKKATDSKILRDVLVKGDAYWRTGDALKWDSDGRIWFSDRLGDTFRWKSENVSTMEVGEVIGYHPAVTEANVYGVTVPGYEGRAGCAALVMKSSALENTTAGEINVKPDVLRSLATYGKNSLQKASVPVFLRVTREMAVTGNHKTLKNVLRNQGIDLAAIRDAGSTDQIYWLEPGADGYAKFGREQWDALKSGKTRL